jgi:hypothetical protein
LTNDMNPNSTAVIFENVDATCNTSHTKLDVTLAYAAGIPASIIILLTIFGNIVVLCTKAQVGHRQTMLLVWNLGLADLLVGVVVLPMSIHHLITRRWVGGGIESGSTLSRIRRYSAVFCVASGCVVTSSFVRRRS